MSKRDDLLKYLEEKKISIAQAIDILAQEEFAFLSKKDRKETAVLPKYETRGT